MSTELGAALSEFLRGAWRNEPPALEASLAMVDEVREPLLRSGAGGLGWWRLRDTALRSSPAAHALHQAFRLHSLQAGMHEASIEAIVTRLREGGVAPILAKGWAVARLYPSPGLRPYGDIDLYVRPEDHTAARALVDGIPDTYDAVDLHAGCPPLDDRPWAGLDARADVVTLGRTEVRVFGPEDHLRYLALHMLGHGAWRPLWLCDLALALQLRPPGFDWEYFLSGDARRTDWTLCALALARDLLGADLSGAPAVVRDKDLPGWLEPTVLRQWGASDFEPHGNRVPMEEQLRHPARLWSALRLRWPNAVEATVEVRGRFNELPRLPFQLLACLTRSGRFIRRFLRPPAASGARAKLPA